MIPFLRSALSTEHVECTVSVLCGCVMIIQQVTGCSGNMLQSIVRRPILLQLKFEIQLMCRSRIVAVNKYDVIAVWRSDK